MSTHHHDDNHGRTDDHDDGGADIDDHDPRDHDNDPLGRIFDLFIDDPDDLNHVDPSFLKHSSAFFDDDPDSPDTAPHG